VKKMNTTLDAITRDAVAAHLIDIVPQRWDYAGASKTRRAEMERQGRKRAKTVRAADVDQWADAIDLARTVMAGAKAVSTDRTAADLARWILDTAGIAYAGASVFEIGTGVSYETLELRTVRS
jgi:hypothetical protein